MGYNRSHTIVVEGYFGSDADDILNQTHGKAKMLFGSRVSDILGPFTNGSGSFFIAPDGSKEGWEESDVNDEKRDELIKWMVNHIDYIAWVEVQFNDDDGETIVTRHSDAE